MKKAITALVLSLVVLAVFGPEAKAQIPKEGTTSFTGSYSGTAKILAMGQERVHTTYEFMGVDIGETPEDLHHNASFRCIGASHVAKGESEGFSFCVATRSDGDQIFAIYKTAYKIGTPAKGTFTIVGGTGKLVGIQGSGEITITSMRPAAEGTFQAYARQKGQYKLP